MIPFLSFSHKRHHCPKRFQKNWVPIVNVFLKELGTYWWLWLVSHNNYWFLSLNLRLKCLSIVWYLRRTTFMMCFFFKKKIFFYSIWHSFGFCVILEMLPKLTFCKCHLDFLCRALPSVLIEKCETWMTPTGHPTSEYEYRRKWYINYKYNTCSDVAATTSLFSRCLQVITCRSSHLKKKRINSKEIKQL